MKHIFLSIAIVLVVVTSVLLISNYTKLSRMPSNTYNPDFEDISYLSYPDVHYSGRFTLAIGSEQGSEWSDENNSLNGKINISRRNSSYILYSTQLVNFPIIVDDVKYLNIFDYLENYSGTNVFEHTSVSYNLDVSQYLSYCPTSIVTDLLSNFDTNWKAYTLYIPIRYANATFYIGTPYTVNQDGVTYTYLDWRIRFWNVKIVPDSLTYMASYKLMDTYVEVCRPELNWDEVGSFADFWDSLGATVFYPISWLKYLINTPKVVTSSFNVFN